MWRLGELHRTTAQGPTPNTGEELEEEGTEVGWMDGQMVATYGVLMGHQ